VSLKAIIRVRVAYESSACTAHNGAGRGPTDQEERGHGLEWERRMRVYGGKCVKGRFKVYGLWSLADGLSNVN
jgi:hypothetical protein